jgi:hypothetical protein
VLVKVRDQQSMMTSSISLVKKGGWEVVSAFRRICRRDVVMGISRICLSISAINICTQGASSALASTSWQMRIHTCTRIGQDV